ncbi:MAG: hypothetical protein KZQ76_13760 [Candidatus Thiodiazotropha sp. (ex Epidulcina cf. delphinae)]|nr:hypothetical protein [Candidatus Thiodiazotropha sp. (ex Epidulcina cf. delphinae)]
MSTEPRIANHKCHQKRLPAYQGLEWIEVELPIASELWLLGKQYSVAKERGQRNSAERLLGEVVRQDKWHWPKRALFFLSDLHADADAFIASLVASGGVKKTGKNDRDLKLTSGGRRADFVIGGDCLRDQALCGCCASYVD